MTDPILITGCARSGTSLVAGSIDICGAYGGKTCGATLANKKGQFENNEIRNEITKPFLRSNGYDPMGQNPLPDIEHIKSVVTEEVAARHREEVLKIFKRQGYTDGPWYIKEAKSCLIWPLWAKAFPDAKWIIVRRPDGDIINSCLRTAFMRAYRGREGWQGWINHHKDRFNEMILEPLQVAVSWPEDLIAGNLRGIQNIVERYGLAWNEEAVREFIEPKLWKKGETK